MHLSISRPRVAILFALALLLLAARDTSSAVAPPLGGKPGAWQAHLAPAGEPGLPFVFDGAVYSLPDSQPVRGARVHAFHADARGAYGATGDRRARLAGDATTNVAGGFQLCSVLPGRAGGESSVNLEITLPTGEWRMTSVTFARRHGAGSDAGLATLAWMVDLPQDSPWAYVEHASDGVYHANARFYVRRGERAR